MNSHKKLCLQRCYKISRWSQVTTGHYSQHVSTIIFLNQIWSNFADWVNILLFLYFSKQCKKTNPFINVNHALTNGNKKSVTLIYFVLQVKIVILFLIEWCDCNIMVGQGFPMRTGGEGFIIFMKILDFHICCKIPQFSEKNVIYN